MSAQELHANAELISDSERCEMFLRPSTQLIRIRLVATLQAGFQGLMRKQEEQMNSQQEHAEKYGIPIDA
jgi:hypothetical protein